MRRLVVTLDDELDNLLAKKTNQSEFIRVTLRLYIGDITPDRLEAMQAAFNQMKQTTTQNHTETQEQLTYLTEQVERLANKVPDQF